ncbi:MAG: TIGR01459 family HAD-type hydrolase [Ahrensia sp.]|nr:TIGR01459 family HAD-type hydrolase [Ahrensia sp.]
MTRHISALSDIAGTYDAIFCDVWGVVHNGRNIHNAAAEALSDFRKSGGHVVLITNSPRPHEGVAEQLWQLGLSGGVYDAIATSGDVTRALIKQAQQPVFHLGPERDRPLFDGLDVALAPFEEARSIVCTGLFDDEQEGPEDYRGFFEEALQRDLPFICANPDIVVERGDRLIWCAGALARLYEELGGNCLLAGKPHAPIYELARLKLTKLADDQIDDTKILAIGDGMPTDVKGAQDNGFDLLYVAGGIHAADYGGTEPDPAALEAFLMHHGAKPVAWIQHLS